MSDSISAAVSTLVEMPPGTMHFSLPPPRTPPHSSTTNFASGVPYLVNVLTDPEDIYPRQSNLG